MKLYDYTKAKRLIEKNKENLISASLGMLEDWLWTSETIFKDGKFIKELPDNVKELQEYFHKARKEGLSPFLPEDNKDKLPKLNPEYEKYSDSQIMGLYGSVWATPTLKLYFKDGTEKTIPCHNNGSSSEKPSSFDVAMELFQDIFGTSEDK